MQVSKAKALARQTLTLAVLAVMDHRFLRSGPKKTKVFGEAINWQGVARESAFWSVVLQRVENNTDLACVYGSQP